jgi:N12 class adenine-specific DNA methylase
MTFTKPTLQQTKIYNLDNSTANSSVNLNSSYNKLYNNTVNTTNNLNNNIINNLNNNIINNLKYIEEDVSEFDIYSVKRNYGNNKYKYKNKNQKYKKPVENIMFDVNEFIYNLLDIINNNKNPIPYIFYNNNKFLFAILLITFGTIILLFNGLLK